MNIKVNKNEKIGISDFYAAVAQLAAQVICNHWVEGSSPFSGSKKKRHLKGE